MEMTVAILNGRTGLVEAGLPSAAKKPCFDCGRPLHRKDPTFAWCGSDDTLVMHMTCLPNFLRRATKDRDKFFGVTA